MKISKISEKSSGNSFPFSKFELSTFPWRNFDYDLQMLVLLYEFQAETRLTVYRRLDILVQEEPPSRIDRVYL